MTVVEKSTLSRIPIVREVVLVSKVAAAADIVAITLGGVGGAELPKWSPGAHIDVEIAGGDVRQYSLCGDPSAATWRIGVLRDPAGRGGSAHVHDNLKVGDVLRVHGPRNHFALEPAGSYLFIAGGIGITPILPMVAELERRRVPWRLVYGGRSLSSMGFQDDLAPFSSKVTLWPEDERGRPDLGALLADPRNDEFVYACGPEPLLAAIETAIEHWPSDSLRTERFRSRESQGVVDAAFDVELASTGQVMTIPVGASVLDALEEVGIEVESSCREGTCGSCETTVLAGTPDHRDSVLTAAERDSNESMMVCVSRCVGRRLLLDL